MMRCMRVISNQFKMMYKCVKDVRKLIKNKIAIEWNGMKWDGRSDIFYSYNVNAYAYASSIGQMECAIVIKLFIIFIEFESLVRNLISNRYHNNKKCRIEMELNYFAFSQKFF